MPPQEPDLASFGFGSFQEYRLWCLCQGYSDGLSISQADLPQPAGAYEGRRALHDTEARRLAIRRTVAGVVERSDAFDALDNSDAGRNALLDLMLHTNRYMDVLKTKLLSREVGRHRELSYGLVALALHHDRWIRPVESWISPLPTQGSPRREDQFSSLVRHLVARYEVPQFMDRVWFEGAGERGREHRKWFIDVASGRSIRTMDTPIRLTRRMAHLFMRGAYPKGGLEQNMRWAQIIAMGGSFAQANAILRTRMGRRFEDDDFWSTVVLFIANNPMLDPTWIGPIVDYIHAMRSVPTQVQAESEITQGPPRQPHLTMKGRSATKLLGQVEAWHELLNREDGVAFQHWRQSGLSNLELVEETSQLGKVRWTVRELLSSQELAAEGRAMNHCVVSYSDQCAAGDTAIWSICAHREAQPENVLTAALDTRRQTVTEVRGRYNMVPNKRPASAQGRAQERAGYMALLQRANVVLNQWIKREGLQRD
ncbi:MAG: hypothetical protein HOE86_12680 [Gemmatimonadetes bacterium]|nr:hypothetical protein [Gemmatimonadota bacterium]